MTTEEAIEHARNYLDCVEKGALADDREAALCRAIIDLATRLGGREVEHG